jgi:catechol 2,3-dioxygenase-like lactoylglutathione lyase family enzyme
MKRLHVHVAVDDLAQSIRFYSTLFAAAPSVLKDDYAKWMLEDPRVNFAISTGSGDTGISHLGIQAEDETELAEVYERLSRAERPVIEEKGATCCYARSDKQWVADPQGVPWETFFTYGEATVYGRSGALTRLGEASGGLSTCGCAPAEINRPVPAESAPTDACCAPSCCAN